MADITVTAGSVLPKSGATIDSTRKAGATITAGQAVYLDATTDTYKLADANDTALTAAARGIALNGASSGQPISVQTAGPINPGATVAVGQIYVASATPGGVAPYADITSTQFVTILGVASTTTQIEMLVQATGIAKA